MAGLPGRPFRNAGHLSLAYFAFNRAENSPERLDRKSRFYGSHTGPAWGVLGMIFLVVFTLFVYRGAQINTGHFPFGPDHHGSWWEFASMGFAKALHPLGHTANGAHRDDLHPAPTSW